MTDKTIRVGDMVVVIRPAPCCGSTSQMGLTFTVNSLLTGSAHCGHCLKLTPDTEKGVNGEYGNFFMSRVIKVNPDFKEKTTETNKELETL